MIQRLLQRLAGLRIDTRLRVAFGVLVAMTMLIAAAAYVTQRAVANEIEETISVALAIQAEVGAIDSGVNGALLETNEFLVAVPIDGYTVARVAHFDPAVRTLALTRRTNISDLRDLVAQTDPQTQAAITSRLDEIETELREMDLDLRTIADAIDARGNLYTGRILAATQTFDAIYETIDRADSPDAKIAALQVRELSQRYFQESDPDTLDELNSAIALLKLEVNSSPELRSEFDDIEAELDRYQAQLAEIVQLTQTFQASFDSFSDTDERLDPQLEEINEIASQQVESSFEAIAIAERNGRYVRWVIVVVAIVASIVLASAVARTIVQPLSVISDTATAITRGDLTKRTNLTAPDSLGETGRTIDSMASRLESLISSLQARTDDMARTLEVGQLATSLYSLEDLLPRLVEFIRSSFDLYYTQVYLIDEGARYAVLAAGTGEVGEQLVAFGHRIDLRDTSMVGRATQDREPIRVEDTTQSQVHLPNPLLPETRSELSVPLISGGRVIGVLDMQSTEPGTFTADNQPVFAAMANQIAAALANARLFEEAQNAIEAAAAVNMRLTGDSWQTYLGRAAEQNRVGYDYNLSQPQELGSAETIEDRYAAQIAQPGTTIDQPIELRGLQIGRFFVGEDHKRQWSDDELRLVNDVANQIAQATEQYRALDELREREQRLESFSIRLQSLQDITQELAAEVNPGDEAYRGVLASMTQLIEAGAGALLLADSAGIYNHFITTGASEAAIQEIAGSESQKGFMTSAIASEGTLLRMNHLPDESISAAELTLNSMLGIPLRTEGRSLGYVLFLNHKRNAFGDDEEALATSFAAVLSRTLEASAYFEQTEIRARELQTVAQVSAEAATTLDIELLLQNVVDLTQERFNLYHAHIYLLDDDGQSLRLAAGVGEPGTMMREAGHAIPADHPYSVVASAARNLRAEINNDVTAGAAFLPNPLLPETRSEMALPLIVGGQVLGVLDVQSTERDRFARQDEQVLGTLARQVAVAVQNARSFQQVVETAEQLREVDRLKSEFLANMSHELRTPLNSIIGYSELLIDDIGGSLDELSVEDLKAIHSSGHHLLAIINDILDLAKIEAGQLSLNPEPMGMHNIVDQVVEMSRVLLKDKPGVELQVAVPDDLPLVSGDTIRLRQILWNLLSNAIKFTETGHVRIAAEADDQNMHLSVTDTGVGIPDEYQATIFDQFRQVDGSATRKAGGTGLGLTISRQLMQLHGGDLRVESVFGQGSTFIATLPLSRKDETISSEENVPAGD